MRITGGRLGGRRLRAPAGRATRPTADRVKEALFNILGAQVEGARVLDLFAGSGALGLEALSRGAVGCLLVEKAPATAGLIRRNLDDLGLRDVARVLVADAIRAAARWQGQGPFDLILADPPYERGLVQPTAELAAAALAPGGSLVIEHSPRERPQPPPGFHVDDRRAYGQSELSFIIAGESEDS